MGGRYTIEYQLHDTTHEAYLDFYQAVARDFGICLPRNRREATKTVSQIRYRALLTESLSSNIYYGYGDPAVLPAGFSRRHFRCHLLRCGDVERRPGFIPHFAHARPRTLGARRICISPRNKPRWASDGPGVSDYWAPELHHVNGEYRVYFAARLKDGGELAIGVARSPRPEERFTADSLPLSAGGVIDPHLQ